MGLGLRKAMWTRNSVWVITGIRRTIEVTGVAKTTHPARAWGGGKCILQVWEET